MKGFSLKKKKKLPMPDIHLYTMKNLSYQEIKLSLLMHKNSQL